MKKFVVPCISCNHKNVIITESDELFIAAMGIQATEGLPASVPDPKQPEGKPGKTEKKVEVKNGDLKKRVQELKAQEMDSIEIAKTLNISPATVDKLWD